MAELAPEFVPARVTGQHRREWDVAGVDLRRRAVLAGKRWAKDDVAAEEAQPTIGDWVAVRVLPDDAPPVIEHILERRTELVRGAVGRPGSRQVIVANVDLVAVVAAFAVPEAQDAVALRSLNPRRIERYLTAVQKGGARALVLLHKADLRRESVEQAEELRARLSGTPVLLTNSESDDGLDPLLPFLEAGKTIGFVGLSGVGKSTIVNQLLGRSAQKTGASRDQDSRGRHTTTHRELFVTADGWLLIDTPGMREFALGDGEDADLSAFSDIAGWALECRFRDCRHDGEPGCAVEAAARSGALPADRLANYRTLAGELRDAEGRSKRRAGPAPRKNPAHPRSRSKSAGKKPS